MERIATQAEGGVGQVMGTVEQVVAEKVYTEGHAVASLRRKLGGLETGGSLETNDGCRASGSNGERARFAKWEEDIE